MISHRIDPDFSVSDLPAPFLSEAGLYPCPTCNDPNKVYASQANLDRHCRRFHTPSRSRLNSELLTALFPDSTWDSALSWLSSHDVKPPPFRHNWYPKLSHTDKSLVYHSMNSLCKAVIQSSVPVADSFSDAPSRETTSDPLWKLLFLFQALIFCPFKENPSFTYSRCLSHRLQLFHRGDIQTLYNHAYDPDRPIRASSQADAELHNFLNDDLDLPDSPDSPSNITVSSRNASKAQKLADLDEYSRAVKALSQNQPVASLDKPIIKHITATLFPSPYPPHSDKANARYQTRSATRQQHQSALAVRVEPLLKALRSAKKGTAAGPFADYIDFLRNFALFERQDDSRSKSHPYLQTFADLLQLLLDGTVSPSISKSFSCTYFLALHKSPTDPLKLRPIGIGTCFRRLLCAVSLAHLSDDFAAHLLPGGQLGVGVHGGLDTIVQLSRAMLESYITRPLSAGLPPSHAMLLLDLTNMFNAVSRESARSALADHDTFRSLLPLFDLLYDTANACWYRTPDSDWSVFSQHEGFAQGCPLSPVFAALVLNLVLPQLNRELDARTSARGLPRTDSLSYLDDTGIFLRFADISFFLERLSTLGRPHGIFISYDKTHLLTSTTGASPMPLLAPSDATALTEALDFLASHDNKEPELTSGVRLLGCPLGGLAFTTSFLVKAISSFTDDIQRLNIGLSDLQTRAALFRFSVRASVDHLLDSDFYAHASLTRPASPTDWSSLFTQQIDSITHTFIRHLTSSTNLPTDPNLPAHSAALLYLPASLGGIGFRSPFVSATSAYVIPMARSIRLAHNGIVPFTSSEPSHLPISHQNLLLRWQSSDLRIHRLFRLYGKSLLHYRFPDDPSAHALTTLTDSPLDLRGFRRDFHRLHYKRLLPTLADSPAISVHLESLTVPWMSIPLHSMSRQHKDQRLDNRTYRLALMRRLRLPLLPPSLVDTNCTCGKPLDPFGDHIFSCPNAHKGKLSNAIRDTNAHLLRTLAPLAAFTDSPDSVTIETPQLAPSDLRKRPADVGMHLSPSYLPRQSPHAARYVALDVTVPAPALSSGVSQSAVTATQRHLVAEKQKFDDNTSSPRQQVFQDLVNQNIILLPFTVDHLGGLGTCGHRFYFGPDPHKAPDPTLSPPRDRNGALLYARAYGPHAPTDLFRRADENWTRLHPFTRYGRSYHTSLPSHWAQQFLGLNLTVLLTTHLSSRLRSLESHHRRLSPSARRKLYAPIGRPYSTKCFTSRLRTLRTDHDL